MRKDLQWLPAAGLVALLILLASLQYRWLESVRIADREKSHAVLQTAATRFAEDFDRELTRGFLTLRPISGLRSTDENFVDRWQQWQNSAAWPELVRDLFVVRSITEEDAELTRFDPAQGSFLTTQWPDELEVLHDRLKSLVLNRRSAPPDRLTFLADAGPALIGPLFAGPPKDGPPDEAGGKEGPGRRGRNPGRFPFGQDFVILWLDQDLITGTILPQLTERYFRGGEEEAFHVRVLAIGDQREIFRGGATMQRSAETDGGALDGDAMVPLFYLLPAETLGNPRPGGSSGLHNQRRRGEGRGADHGGRSGRWFRRLYNTISQQEQPRWRLVVSHPSGSLEAAVDRAHRRNLAISFGILLLLGSSFLLMLFSTRKTRALARQQLEFVAGVTHELLTPLAAMRSAGQNLADGVVTESGQVKRYGRLIEDEGRRLTTMVGQVLEFAGMQAGHRAYSLRRVSLHDVLAQALEEYRSVLDEDGITVESNLEETIPDVTADPAPLRRAIQNLIANAIKYRGASSWIGLETRRVDGPDGSEVHLTVADRGPGIAAVDVPHLFEPFYRGNTGSDDQIPGSGLGLSLVEHIAEGHGGRVIVSTEEGKGSRFTIVLPIEPSEGNTDEV